MGLGFLVLLVAAFAVGEAGAADADGAALGLGAGQRARVAASASAGGFIVDGALHAGPGFADRPSPYADACGIVAAGEALVIGPAARRFGLGAVGVLQAAGDAAPIHADGPVPLAVHMLKTLHASTAREVADRRLVATICIAAAPGDTALPFAERRRSRAVVLRQALDAELRLRIAARRFSLALCVAAAPGDTARVFADRLVRAALRVVLAGPHASMVQAKTLAALRVLVALHALPTVGIAIRRPCLCRAVSVRVTRRAGPKLQLAKRQARRAVEVLGAGDDRIVFGQTSRKRSEDCAQYQAYEKWAVVHVSLSLSNLGGSGSAKG